MFHVKHSCPIGAENLTSAHPRAGIKRVGLRKKLVRLDGASRRGASTYQGEAAEGENDRK